MSTERLHSSWFFLGNSAEFSDQKPVRVKIGKQSWVVYRNGQKLVALDSRCAHMGTDLSAGRIIGGTVACPLHNWKYAPDGNCVSAPGCPQIPEFARLKSYLTAERHGMAFIYLGVPNTAHPLPFFIGQNPAEFTASAPFRLEVGCTWQVQSANAFDVYHFEQFHGRKLIAPPKITHPDDRAYRIEHEFKITRPSFADRFLIAAGGKHGIFDYTTWMGNFVLLRVQFQKIVNFMQIIVHPFATPTGEDRCEVFISVLNKKGEASIPLFLKRFMTRKFFEPEAQDLTQVQYNPATLVPQDKSLKDYMEWLSSRTGPG